MCAILWINPGATAILPLSVYQAAIWQFADAWLLSRSQGNGRFSINNVIVCSASKVAKGWRDTAHKILIAWSKSRIPVDEIQLFILIAGRIHCPKCRFSFASHYGDFSGNNLFFKINYFLKLTIGYFSNEAIMRRYFSQRV